MKQAPKNETADFETPQIGNHITNVRRENRHTTTTKTKEIFKTSKIRLLYIRKADEFQ